jgi:hypothetical protein
MKKPSNLFWAFILSLFSGLFIAGGIFYQFDIDSLYIEEADRDGRMGMAMGIIFMQVVPYECLGGGFGLIAIFILAQIFLRQPKLKWSFYSIACYVCLVPLFVGLLLLVRILIRIFGP